MLRFSIAAGVVLGLVLQAGEAEVPYGRAFRPPRGSVLHGAGQTREDFVHYVEKVSEDGRSAPRPATMACYTNLEGQGLSAPFALAAGDPHQDLSFLLRTYEDTAPQIAVYLHFLQLKEIADGRHDGRIAALAQTLKAISRPLYLRIGYEFDNPSNAFEPAKYVAAYRRIVEKLHGAGLRDVSYVWHSWALQPTFQNRDPLEWYPGDRYVNWIGVSIFQISGKTPFKGSNRDRMVEIARSKRLPVMICEASPVRFSPEQKAMTGEAYWKYWFEPFFEFIRKNPEVEAFSMIHVDWDAVSLTRKFGWGDCRMTADPEILVRWRREMSDERYLHRRRDLYEKLGFSPR